jgi:hypothetical protein
MCDTLCTIFINFAINQYHVGGDIMKAIIIIFILLLVPVVLAKEMPIPHFTPTDCACPELGWPIKSNYSSYGLALDCIYQKSDDKTDYYNSLYLHITSWYDPEDTKEAFEIYRNYDYKNEKEGYGKNKFIVEDINEKDKISFIYRTGNSSYWIGRRVHYTETPLIAISGNYNKYRADKNQKPIDGEVIAWADGLEKCAKRLIDAQDLSSEKVNGKITVLGFPIKYATIYVDPQQKTTTNDKGEFTLSVPNKEHYDITLEFQYEKNNHIFYRVLMDRNPIALKIEVLNNKINSMDIDVGLASYSIDNVSQDITKELSLDRLIQDKQLLSIPVNYLHMQEALEYYTDVLGVDLSKKTVDLYIFSIQKTAYGFDENKQWINIDADKSSYEDNFRPFTTYHEFTHYVEHTLVGTEAFASYLDDKNINHGGYANEKTSDSFSEGLAAFMATIIADHYNRYWADETSSQASLYPYFGSLEPDIVAWEYQGQGEEYAIAGILWDLTDGVEEARKDNAGDKAAVRSIMQEQFKAYDFNKDGVWDRSEFIHSLIDREEYNGNFDQYFDERELPILAAGFVGENKSDAFLKKMLPYGKTEPGSLTQEEMHLFIKDNIDFFEASLKEDIGDGYSELPRIITFDMMMEKVTGSPDDDKVDMQIEELWKLIKQTNFSLPYKDLKADDIFIKHGFYIETSEGDHNYTFGEPYLNKNKNKRRDADEPFIDLGVMHYDGTEKMGVASNYERINRKSSVPLSGQFIKVNKEIPFYEAEYVVYNTDYFGLPLPTMVYKIRSRNEDGLIYLPLPRDAIVKVMPEGVITKEPLVFSSEAFMQQYSDSVDKGYFIEHKFTYTGAPPAYKNTLKKNSWDVVLYVGIFAAVAIIAVLLLRKKRRNSKKHRI